MRLFVALVLLFIIASGVQAQTEVCRLRTYYSDREAKLSTSWSLVGEFPLSFADDSMTRLFHDEESGVNISVGVEQVKSIFEKTPIIIKVAISFIGKPEDVFDEVDNAEAETFYDKSWKWSAVSKNIKVKSRTYTFQFGCERRRKRNAR